MKGPFTDPQHPYMYEEEDMWMAPGFINQFYPVSFLGSSVTLSEKISSCGWGYNCCARIMGCLVGNAGSYNAHCHWRWISLHTRYISSVLVIPASWIPVNDRCRNSGRGTWGKSTLNKKCGLIHLLKHLFESRCLLNSSTYGKKVQSTASVVSMFVF